MSKEQLQRLIEENEQLRTRLQEAEDTVEAIRQGAVDALVVQGPQGEQVFTLSGEDVIYRRLVETMNEAGLTVTPEGAVLFCNQRFADMVRVPMEEIIGRPLRRFVKASSYADLGVLLEVVQAGPYRQRMVFRASDGTAVPAQVAANVLRQADMVSVCLVATDTTELETEIADRRSAEETAKRERQRLYEVLETLPVYVILLTPDYHVPFANRFFRERFGESHGKRCFEYLFNRTEPCENCDTYTVLKTMQPHHWEWTGPDQRTYDIYDYPFTEADGNMLILEMGIDITEQRKAESELKRYGDNLQELVRERTQELQAANEKLQEQAEEMAAQAEELRISNEELRQQGEDLRQSRMDLTRAQEVGQIGWWRLSVEGDVLTWSDETYRMFGVPQGTPMTYASFKEIVHPDDRELIDTEWQAALHGESRAEPYDLEHRIVVNGQVKWIREKAYPEYDKHGKLLGGFGIAQDITERKQAEEALRRVNETLEQRVRDRTAELHDKNRELRRRAEQLSRFASEVTLAEQRERHRLAKVLHDHLQQLLVAAKLGLQMFSEEIKDRPQKEALHDVYDLITQSIAASRSLTVELSPTILHEAGLAAGLEWLARWTEQKHGLVVDLQVEGEAQTEREDIRILLFESVRELLFNVVKHAGVTRAKVHVARRGANLEIVVSDEGKGFDPEQLSNGSESTVGFGLFSIRERLELLGGSVKIESWPQRGSRFTLTAPAVYPSKEVVPRTKKAPMRPERQEPIKAAAAEPALRVLIVDDHKVIRQGMAARLKREPDLEIAGEAGNGEEAIAKAHELRPDVILMDFSMPRMDGVQATRKIHEDLPDIRIIGLSMYEEADRARAMLDAGAAGYVTKSAELDELLSAIRAHTTA